jgi:hypothetical protein
LFGGTRYLSKNGESVPACCEIYTRRIKRENAGGINDIRVGLNTREKRQARNE